MNIEFNQTVYLKNKFGDKIEHDVLVNVTGYWPGRPGFMYRKNGDPGDPPEPEEVEYDIYALHGTRTRLLPHWCKFYEGEDIIEQIERAAIEAVEENERDSFIDAMERRADERAGR